jgi:hypothetical protein
MTTLALDIGGTKIAEALTAADGEVGAVGEGGGEQGARFG